jgi:hypothetical protein
MMTQAQGLESQELGSGVYFFEHQVGGESEQEIEEVAVRLKAVCGSHSLQAALEAGDIIFRHLFRSDERMLRARGKKCSSFRKLANHPRLGMSPSSLWRAVAIFELSRRFPELCKYAHSGVGHVSVVLGLPSAEQFRLLRDCEANRWTRRHLQTVVLELRSTARVNPQPPTARVVERLKGLEMLLLDTERDDRMAHLRPDEIRQALLLLERIRSRFGEVRTKLYQRLPAEMNAGLEAC